jgi:multimeric flavodoxin WrbA
LGFDPVLSTEELRRYDSQTGEVPADVKAEQEEILWADQLIFIYPTWWWSMPVIMKGYLFPDLRFLSKKTDQRVYQKEKKAGSSKPLGPIRLI